MDPRNPQYATPPLPQQQQTIADAVEIGSVEPILTPSPPPPTAADFDRSLSASHPDDDSHTSSNTDATATTTSAIATTTTTAATTTAAPSATIHSTNPSSTTGSESTSFSSFFGSLSRPTPRPNHKRHPSSVSGWDSEDDEEMDRAAAGVATSTAESVVDFGPQPYFEKSPWLQSEKRKQKQVRTCICLGVILCCLVMGAVLAYVYREQIFQHSGQKPASQTKRTQSDNEGLSIESAFNVNATIVADSNLSKVFYGIDYTPRGSQEPDCKVNLGHVIEDLKVLSQMTTRIRLYGMACQQTETVLKAIEYLGLDDMQLVLTLWVDSSTLSWEKQSRLFWNLMDRNLIMDATSSVSKLRQTNSKMVSKADSEPFVISKVASRIMGISVGNEVLFRNEDPNNTEGHVPVSTLTGYIAEIRQGLAERAAAAAASGDEAIEALGKHVAGIPVFSSDLGRNAQQIVDQVDWVMSNIHPFFANQVAEEATDWSLANLQDETMKAAAGKPAIISEIGWPSGPTSAIL
ncbi:hypothetical protein BGZ98_005475, partial [Dissophora globulifera]